MSKMPWIITAISVVAISSGLSLFKYSEINAAVAYAQSLPEFSETVEADRALLLEHAPTITVIGVAVAPEFVDLRNEFQGKIVSVNYRSGEMIKEGEIILQFDFSEEKATLQSYEAQVQLSQARFERINKLKNSSAISQEQLDQAQANYRIANADVQRLNAVIEKKTVRAPFDGIIGLHNFEVGQFLESNTLIASFVGDNEFTWIDFNVPQIYDILSVGDKVKMKLVTNNSEQNDPVESEIIAISPIILEASRTRQYRARINNDILKLTPNAAVEIYIPTAKPTPKIAIPAVAIQNGRLGQYVYLLNEDDSHSYRAHNQSVTINGRDDGVVFIESGVKKNDLVATFGAFKLFEGILVNVKQREKRVHTLDDKSLLSSTESVE